MKGTFADPFELMALLENWLGESRDSTLAGDTGFKHGFLRGPIGVVPCSMSGDTTRRGVELALQTLDSSGLVFWVVPNQRDKLNRIAVGREPTLVPGFYLYADDEQDVSSIIYGEARRVPLERTDDAATAEFAADVDLGEQVDDTSLTLSHVSVADLWLRHAETLAELKARGVIWTAGNPAGDYGEWLVAEALGGELQPPANAAFDVFSEIYGRVQVKTRTLANPPKATDLQSGTFHGEGFDHAALIQLDRKTFRIVRATLLPVAEVSAAQCAGAHGNGWFVKMTPALMGAGIDITQDLIRSAGGLG